MYYTDVGESNTSGSDAFSKMIWDLHTYDLNDWSLETQKWETNHERYKYRNLPVDCYKPVKQNETTSIRFTRFKPYSRDIRKVSTIFPLWCWYLRLKSKTTTNNAIFRLSTWRKKTRTPLNLPHFEVVYNQSHHFISFPRPVHLAPAAVLIPRRSTPRKRQELATNGPHSGHGWTWGLHLIEH